MSEKRIIEVDLDVAEANKKLNGLNKNLDKVAASGGKVGSSIDQGASKLSAFQGVVKRVSSAFKSMLGVVKSIGKGIAIGIGAALAGVFVMLKGVKSGLNDITSGLDVLVRRQYAKRAFGDLPVAIQDATANLIGLEEAGEFIRRGRGLGLSDDQLEKFARIGVAGGLLSGRGATRGIKQLMDAAVSGSSEILKNVSPALSIAVRSALDLAGNISMVGKRQLIVNTITKEYSNVMKEIAGVLEDPLVRMLGFIKEMKEESEGLLTVLKGFGTVALSILAPLGIGIAAFALGGPIAGVIGSVLGLAISGTAAATAISFAQEAAKESQKDGKKSMSFFSAVLDVAEDLFGAFANAMTGESFKADFNKEALDRLGIGGKIKKILGGVRTLALGLREFAHEFFKALNFDEIIARIASKIGGGKPENIIEILGKMGNSIGRLTKGLIELGEAITPALLSAFEKFVVLVQALSFELSANPESITGKVFKWMQSVPNESDENKKKRKELFDKFNPPTDKPTTSALTGIESEVALASMPREAGIASAAGVRRSRSGPKLQQDISLLVDAITEQTASTGELIAQLKTQQEGLR